MKITVGQLRQIIKETVEAAMPMPPFRNMLLAASEREASVMRPRQRTEVIIFDKDEIAGLSQDDLRKTVENKLPQIKGLADVKMLFGYDASRMDESGDPGVYFAEVTWY